MKSVIIIFIALALEGCGIYECVDEKFVRETKPIEQEFNVELMLNETSWNMIIKCEEYYDAMCAERGNYWAIREVGYKSQYQTSIFKISDHDLGQVEVPIPKCTDMVKGRETPLKHLVLKIGGENYWLQSSTGNKRIYKPSKQSPKGEHSVEVDLLLKVNNVPIK